MTTTSSQSESVGDRERRRITGRAGIVAVGTLLSRLLGLGRDIVLAALFSRAATDAFFVAFTIPNALRQLLAEGAVQNAVLPVLAETKEKQGHQAAQRFFQNLRGLSLSVLLLVSVLGCVLAEPLVSLFAGGFKSDPEQFERTVFLTRWVFPYIFFMGTFALGAAALNTERRFVVTSFSPGLLNVAFIACAFGLPGTLVSMGYEPILSMAIGALVGGALQVVAQWPSLYRVGFAALPRFDFAHPQVREVLRRMGPTLLGIGVYYIDVVVARRLLSELDTGAQSYFAWALRLCDFPQGIFVMALQSAMLPSLASLSAKGDLDELRRTFVFGLKLALFVGFGASAALVALAHPTVALILERGHFTELATRETGNALIAQASAIWAVACVRQLVSVFFALGDTRTPVLVAACDFAVFLSLALLLRGPYGHVGVSMAVAGASIAQMILLSILLRRRIGSFGAADMFKSVSRSLLAAVLASVAGFSVAEASAFGSGGLAKLLPGALGALTFGVVFVGSAALLKSPELFAILDPVRRRRRRSLQG